MINTSDLQALIDKIEGGTQGVDLVKIGQSFVQQAPPRSVRRFRVALDIEGCLDRFYGGYYSDWACGGQFNRCFQFVQLLAAAFQSAQMDVVIFFDGTLKENKKLQLERNDFRQRTVSVLKHIRMIGTPPPKIWWLPPSGLRTCLRNALRSVNIPVVQTIHDHTMEVIDYYHEHKLNAIIGLHPDYIIFNVSRYFSSHDIRLSYKGALETKEYVVSAVLNHLQLVPEQVAIVAVLLGGYILVDEPTLKKIYQKLDIEYNQDFEARIRQLANLIRPIPVGSSAETIIKQLNLTDFSEILKESIEYYQRKGIFGGKRYLGSSKKKPITEIIKNIDVIQDSSPIAPMASETNENDEIANKILKDVNNLVNETDPIPTTSQQEVVRKCIKFVYSLPAEVLRTSYQRHQRGSMDPRIYILLTKKEILLPQVLEDEQYREMPAVHAFYRPARQMIYAILFNLYHQKYMCSKTKDNLPMPEVIIQEWVWSPQNEYKKAEEVHAIQLPWAVPTIQRLWFGTTFEDKHRRMRAFLTVMRSDTPLMLNRTYVPQHLLVLACVLRYIATSPDRNILTRHELDAFIVTAFSPQLTNVEYTQEMVLPGVYLRGVYLATLLMQGVETAQLANDACGVPLPWNLTNPWLFFDGKLFHLKVRMAVSLQNLRELCDDQMDVVMNVERFRKAVLEDIENLVPFNDPIHQRQVYSTNYALYGANSKNITLPSPLHGNYAYNAMQQQMYYTQNMSQYSQRQPGLKTQIQALKNAPRGVSGTSGVIGYQKNNGYQLKVGGVVVGSWATNRSQASRNLANRPVAAGMQIRYPINQRSQRGANNNNRYRVGAGTGGIMTNRFANKQKKVKSVRNKDNNKKNAKEEEAEKEDDADESQEKAEETSDKKSLSKEATVKSEESNENGNREEERKQKESELENGTDNIGDGKSVKVEDSPLSVEDNRNGTDGEQCDKKSSDDATNANSTAIIPDVLSNDDDAVTQQQNNNKNGKNNKKNKKKGKAEVANDEQVNSSPADALKA